MLLIASIIIYLSTAYAMTLFPKEGTTNCKKDREVYLLYNAMHTDIVIEVKEIEITLKEKIQNIIQERKKGYISFGWGDKETYLNTPTWNKLSLLTSMKALFLNTPSVMHVEYLSNIHPYKMVKKIEVSKKQLMLIERNILKSFEKDNDEYFRGYGKDDLFYPSPYSYNLFKTCNTWTGELLREANLSMSYWTPLSSNIIDSL